MTYQERIITCGEQNHLVGIVTEPLHPTNGLAPTVIFLTAGLLNKTGPFRMHTSLARRFATLGLRSCRFDQSGRGDSDAPQSHENELQRARGDISAIMKALESEKSKNFILCGLCSGADDILLTMAEDPRVVGAVFFDAMCHPTLRFLFDRYILRALSLSRWRRLCATILSKFFSTSSPQANSEDLYSRAFPPSSVIKKQLSTFLSRKSKLLFLFTGGITEYMTYEHQFRDAYGPFDIEDRITITYFPKADHTYSSVAARDAMFGSFEGWVTKNFCEKD